MRQTAKAAGGTRYSALRRSAYVVPNPSLVARPLSSFLFPQVPNRSTQLVGQDLIDQQQVEGIESQEPVNRSKNKTSTTTGQRPPGSDGTLPLAHVGEGTRLAWQRISVPARLLFQFPAMRPSPAASITEPSFSGRSRERLGWCEAGSRTCGPRSESNVERARIAHTTRSERARTRSKREKNAFHVPNCFPLGEPRTGHGNW